MDAGIAGVVGAAIGVGGTILATFGTSWFNLRQTRLQLASQREEAGRQRRFDSAKERREPRMKTYADFLGAAHTIKENLDRHEEHYADWGFAGPLVDMLNRARAAVIIAGPPDVARAAGDVLGAFLRIGGRFDASRPPIDVDIEDKMERFAVAAAVALDDIGEPPSTTGAVDPSA